MTMGKKRKGVLMKRQMTFACFDYKDADGNDCEFFEVFNNGERVYEKDYGKDVKKFDDYVHEYYDFSYLNHYFPPTNISIS
jgi:hypothetical protein